MFDFLASVMLERSEEAFQRGQMIDGTRKGGEWMLEICGGWRCDGVEKWLEVQGDLRGMSMWRSGCLVLYQDFCGLGFLWAFF